MVAMKGASAMFAPSCAMDQPTVAIIRVGPEAMTARPTVMIAVPTRIQGRRRPHLPVVRSEMRPNTTLATVAKKAPKPPSTARAELKARPSAPIAPASCSAVTFTPMPTIAGPSSAMKKKNWKRMSQTEYFLSAGSVGSWSQSS